MAQTFAGKDLEGFLEIDTERNEGKDKNSQRRLLEGNEDSSNVSPNIKFTRNKTGAEKMQALHQNIDSIEKRRSNELESQRKTDLGDISGRVDKNATVLTYLEN